jgi:SAM-dependent methyltransferase
VSEQQRTRPEIRDVARTDERAGQATSFGAAAGAYTRHRPDYAEAAVRWALAPADQVSRILDLGAGTGKLTAMLATLDADVFAVEPDPAMLTELHQFLPEVRALSGTAEAIPLPDGSVDAVLCGQSMHWFDMDRALPEIARVLVPGGVLAGLWNSNDDRVAWVAGLQAVIRDTASRPYSYWRTNAANARLGRMESHLFTPAEQAEFSHGQPRTAESLIATIATHARLLVLPEPERARLLAKFRAYLRSQPETSAGEFMLPIVTTGIRMTSRLRSTRAGSAGPPSPRRTRPVPWAARRHPGHRGSRRAPAGSSRRAGRVVPGLRQDRARRPPAAVCPLR